MRGLQALRSPSRGPGHPAAGPGEVESSQEKSPQAPTGVLSWGKQGALGPDPMVDCGQLLPSGGGAGESGSNPGGAYRAEGRRLRGQRPLLGTLGEPLRPPGWTGWRGPTGGTGQGTGGVRGLGRFGQSGRKADGTWRPLPVCSPDRSVPREAPPPRSPRTLLPKPQSPHRCPRQFQAPSAAERQPDPEQNSGCGRRYFLQNNQMCPSPISRTNVDSQLLS